jgi:hypothetical protein
MTCPKCVQFFNRRTAERVLPEVIAAYEGDVRAASLSEMETSLKAVLQEVGEDAIEYWLAAQTPKYPAEEVRCLHCGEQAHYVRWHEARSSTVWGWIRTGVRTMKRSM